MARITHLLRLVPRQRAALAVATSIMLFAPSTAPEAQPGWTPSHWQLTELKPNIGPGGRATTIAVHPNNDNSILVASESGGLFKSQDGGNTWQHVDSLPIFYTNAVRFLPSDPKIVIVSASEDFSVSNRGGIWRSDNAGATWKQVLWKDATSGQIDDGTLAPNLGWPCGYLPRFSAYEISIAPATGNITGNIYVADRCGISRSSDQGKNWTHLDPFGGNQQVLSVLALPKSASGADQLLAGGPAGISRSTDDGTTWVAAQSKESPIGTLDIVIKDMHAFGSSPDANQAYAVAPFELSDSQQTAANLTCDEPGPCVYMVVFVSTDGGEQWYPFAIPRSSTTRHEINGCGGIGFVKSTHNAMYVSSRCIIFEQPYGKSWKPLIEWPTNSDAGDTRDLAFKTTNTIAGPQDVPVLAATDGGLLKPPGGSTKWTFAGANNQGNVVNGYNALQIYQVKGQWIGSSHNLYFGTQDNALWSSDDSKQVWTRCCNEGDFFEGEYRVATSGESQITFHPWDRVDPAWRLKGPLFKCPASDSSCNEAVLGGVEKWPLPKIQGQDCGSTYAPKIIRKYFHVQGVEWVLESKFVPPMTYVADVICAKGLAVTYKLGVDWEPYATLQEDRFDLPRLSFGKKPAGPPVLYQAIRNNDPTKDVFHLARIVGPPCPDPSPIGCVEYPRMETCPATNTCPNTCPPGTTEKFGALGTGPTMERWHRVFAVDPDDVDHLIAPDADSGTMKETRDGGDCWTEITQLTSLVKDGGKLNFSGRKFFNGNGVHGMSLQASAISFNPEHSSMVAVGTVQNGIFISGDGGQNWSKVPGSERATLISALHWRTAQELIASTYGRGLWRVRFVNAGLIADLTKIVGCFPDCYQCLLRPCFPYDQAVLAFGGGIEGGRVVNGILEELFVRPGTSIAFLSDSKEVPDVKVTESKRRVGFLGIKAVPRAPKDTRIISGLTLRRSGRGGELVGFVFARRPLLMEAAESKGPTKERQVRRKESPNAGKPYLELLTGPETGPGGSIRLAGRNYEAGTKIEIAIDGRTVEEVVVARDGRFYASVKAPTEFGLYRITVVDGASRKALDSAAVMVRPTH